MSYRRCSHETNIDVRCHSHSPGVQRRAWCADELCDQALFIRFNPEWLGSARVLNACATATGYAERRSSAPANPPQEITLTGCLQSGDQASNAAATGASTTRRAQANAIPTFIVERKCWE